MRDNEEDRALLREFEVQDSDKACHLEVGNESDSHRRRRYSVSKHLLLFIFLVVLLATVIPIHYLRFNSKHDGQLAIRLHPKQHASREPTTLAFDWTITTGLRSLDGVEKGVYLVNDNFPGPLIEARSGDRLVINVQNDLQDEGISLHWHGLRMKGYNDMDGVVGFTQSPIPSGSTFVYNFTIGDDEHGTFWWHSHADLQRADGLLGGLVVHAPDPNPQPEDYLVMVGDWFHRNQTEILAWYSHASSLGNEPVPDSLLINGKGRFDCSMAVPARPVVCSQITYNELQPLFHSLGDQARVRIVNTGTIAGFTITTDGAKMQTLAVDAGFRVQAEETDRLGVIYPGERIDLIMSKTTSSSPRLIIDLDDENFSFPNPALNRHQVFPLTAGDDASHESYPLQKRVDFLDIQKLIPTTDALDIPPKAHHTLLFYAKTEMLSHLNNEPVAFINHTTWKPQNPPLINLDQSNWDEHQLLPFISASRHEPTRVDIIINNLDDGSHPFHLHGHEFYILSSYKNEGRSGWGSYNPFVSPEPPNKLNLQNPLRKDTVSIPRRGHVVLTFIADNPGIWAFHCHMLVHMARGMAMGFHIGNT